MDDEEVIRFQAQVQKVQTLVDSGIRLTLDLAETQIQTATAMMKAKQAGALLEVVAVPVKVQNLTELDDETKKEPEGKTSKLDSRRLNIRRNK